jgi:hypothetical protein
MRNCPDSKRCNPNGLKIKLKRKTKKLIAAII